MAKGEVESFMKNLGKVLRTAATAGRNKDMELRLFLKAYRETPHSSTGVPPTKLMFLRSRTSGLPEVEEFDFDKLKNLHDLAKRKDRKEKKRRMKEEYDQRMGARELQIQVGMKVLLKAERERKSDPIWDPQPYTVTALKGTMSTAMRGRRGVTRNCSWFKPYYSFGQKQIIYNIYIFTLFMIFTLIFTLAQNGRFQPTIKLIY
jgi:hypothetical protein